MLSARRLFHDIHDNDATFRLLCSIAAAGEAQGGWENERIAALVPGRELAYKIARHGADEDKHARIFRALLRKRNLPELEPPGDTDYIALLTREGIGVAYEQLRRDEPLTDDDVIAYLVHGRVTEQRGADEMRLMREALADRPEMLRALKVIARDEERHLAHCHEELLRMVADDPALAGRVRAELRRTARAESRVHRDVSLAVMARMGRLLDWSPVKGALLAWGIRAVHLYERYLGQRRMTTLRMPPPELRNALGRGTEDSDTDPDTDPDPEPTPVES